MFLANEIGKMYSEIESYNGDFGDPIVDTFSFDPWTYLERNDLSEFERRGVMVALLVILMTAIDNSTYEDALMSDWGIRALALMGSETVKVYPLFTDALKAFDQSEDEFLSALRTIYSEWVQPVTKG
ncbi:hypothetical protein KX928_12865 [Roseobacter sp. YSTF-M11]|uniref:Uncharacterized protein n=1 Tax=Roseobacter insulae TaxID=2859783 RepID=A0A9X1JYV5_9RHOB|nr:hypothetical protein [Roseobacter insulae]MBW4708676.1 hypothetical protein [Roseobacter insulae]